jgi:cellulose synthase/poly-beta-1,6-N-acetylglucosamine synthase-like glycosyltransferase
LKALVLSIVAVALATVSIILAGFYSPTLYNIMFWFAVALWLSYLPFATLIIINILKGLRKYYVARPQGTEGFADPIIFQITSRDCSVAKSSLVSVLNSIRESCRQTSLLNYEIWIVTDSDKEADFFRSMGVEVFVVPEDYVVEGATRKARSLQYANEVRRKLGKNTKEYWVFHLDEESHITPQTVEALKAFIKEGKYLIGTGPIFYPNHFSEASAFTRFADSIRPTGCYICCNQKVPVHMHGSNLLVRADIEDAVGWNNGETIAEDQLFGLKAYERFGEVFGWHGGAIYEQPPLKVEDMISQRKRWFIGTWTNLKYFKPKMKVQVIFNLLTWILGFASAVVSIPYWIVTLMAVPNFFFPKLPLQIPFYHHTPILTPIEILVDILPIPTGGFGDIHKYLKPQFMPALIFGLLLSICFFTWVGTYIIGLHWNTRSLKVSPLTKIRWHLEQLLLLPAIGLLETSAAVLAFSSIIRGEKQDWIPTPKS